MRLNTFYRKDTVFDNNDTAVHMIAYGLIVALVNIVIVLLGDHLIHHVRALGEFEIFPAKEEHAVYYALSGETEIEIETKETRSANVNVTASGGIQYKYTDNPVIESVIWQVEEKGSPSYPIISWVCNVNYSNKQPMWLISSFNGNDLLCK